MSDQKTNLETEKNKSILLTILCAPVFTLVMLAINWIVVPQIINLFVPVNFIGPFAYATDRSHLILDLIYGFASACGIMYCINKIKALYGEAITIFMALCGWGIYFSEVGFVKGMINSMYPLWYESLSFLRYPAAAALALYMTKTKSVKTRNVEKP